MDQILHSPPLPDPALILAIDTAGPACQAVVSSGSKILAETSTAMLRGHGEALVPMIESTLAAADFDYIDLDRIAVTIGPGSFTGMRVGLAAARGLSATLNIPVVGIGTLEALAVSDHQSSGIETARCVSLDARNHLVYGQCFASDGTSLDDPAVIADLVFAASVPAGTRLVGPNNAVIAALTRASNKEITLGDNSSVPLPSALAKLAFAAQVGEKPKPLYLKEADAKVAQPAGLRASAS